MEEAPTVREARRISTASETLAEGEPANSSEKTIIPRRYRAIHLQREAEEKERERKRDGSQNVVMRSCLSDAAQ